MALLTKRTVPKETGTKTLTFRRVEIIRRPPTGRLDVDHVRIYHKFTPPDAIRELSRNHYRPDKRAEPTDRV